MIPNENHENDSLEITRKKHQNLKLCRIFDNIKIIEKAILNPPGTRIKTWKKKKKKFFTIKFKKKKKKKK